MCDRVKDGDCRWNDDGLVLCHTIRGGVVAEGKRHPDRPYIYCGESDKAQGFGKWLPEHRADDKPQKLRREPKESLFTYWFWDGSEVPLQRRRIDYADDRPKDVRWAGTLNGRPEAEIRPYLWKESTTHLATDGGVLFVVRGELKAELLLSLGHNAISILGISERLIAELRRLGRDVVLCPDCDLADLNKWYAELTRQLPQCRHLFSPMKGLNWRQPPEHGGLGVEDWIETAKPDADTLNAAIINEPWQPQPVILDRAETLDDLLGPVEDGKLRRPRTDKLTQAIDIVLPLRFNELTQRIENDGKEVDGDFLNTIYLQLAELHELEINSKRAADAALVVARRNAYHPVRDYLNSGLPKLEEVDWQQIAACCLNTPEPWAQVHLQRQLIGLVARAIKPGCKLDTALVVHSPKQGIGKSTMWAILGGRWFSDSLGDLRNLKDDVLSLHSAWIHEWGEIDSVVGKRESETLKKFLSAQVDNVRKPYGRGVETLQRTCGIVGTTNRDDFIKDPTGNRRFPVISVNSVNTDWVKANRDAIWGSALAAFNANTPWHYSNEENTQISADAQNFAAEDVVLNAVESWCDDHPDLTEVVVARIVWDINRMRMGEQEYSRQVGNRLRILGWTRSKTRTRALLPDGSKTDKTNQWIRPTAPALPQPQPNA
jgi:predicted P-loop ATPase